MAAFSLTRRAGQANASRCDQRKRSCRYHPDPAARRAFTLLELMLALALSVLAMAIIVQLVQMYSSSFATRGEDIRRAALARSILSMIADDLRSSVSKQKFDTSALQQMLMGQGGGGGAGGAGGAGSAGGGSSAGGGAGGGAGGQNAGQGNQAGGGLQSGGTGTGTGTGALGAGGAGAGGTGAGGTGSGSLGSSQGTSGTSSGDTGDESGLTAGGTLLPSSMPLGIYGSLSELTLDVSRLPRPDEYIAQQASIASGVLSDVPGDIKSVTYFVQIPTNMGVGDAMTAVTSTPEASGMVGGLVRRQIDRAVVSNAEEQGQTDQLLRTGDLIAPEVLSLEFAYFDGIEWLTDWDSSTQGLPCLVEISLAMQSKSGEKQGVVPPGISLSTMPYEEQSLYGIEIYTLTVAIPGAQLQATSAESADMAAGMESMGL